ncbi:cwf21 domain-containing protein [Lipomyces arxii]|uniref:cwf21 domain-containing protein n=1 Tax=Lipomyces arxii TaxID=56418 RepID=UPI0034CD6CD5
MSYNNIGLSTPRGSGTNGFVTRNISHLSSRPKSNLQARDESTDQDDKNESLRREPSKEILDHEVKRAIEVKCMDLRMKLEDDDVPDDEIDKQVETLRQTLLKAPVLERTTKHRGPLRRL